MPAGRYRPRAAVVAAGSDKVWFTVLGMNNIGLIDGVADLSNKVPELSVDINKKGKDLLKQLSH